jgi:hypothetical protein
MKKMQMVEIGQKYLALCMKLCVLLLPVALNRHKSILFD